MCNAHTFWSLAAAGSRASALAAVAIAAAVAAVSGVCTVGLEYTAAADGATGRCDDDADHDDRCGVSGK
jgi:hypothetical protein